MNRRLARPAGFIGLPTRKEINRDSRQTKRGGQKRGRSSADARTQSSKCAMQTDEYDEARRFVRQGLQRMHRKQMSRVDKECYHATAHGGMSIPSSMQSSRACQRRQRSGQYLTSQSSEPGTTERTGLYLSCLRSMIPSPLGGV